MTMRLSVRLVGDQVGKAICQYGGSKIVEEGSGFELNKT
jgi:hypothetical protein